MKKPIEEGGRFMRPADVAKYLGVSIARAKSLMNDQSIVSRFLDGEKTPITLEECVEVYLEQTFYPALRLKSKYK